jgi:CDP-4-dehydro-6-deoxyglucose reductase, E1
MINLIKSTFYREKETKKLLTSFITSSSKLSFGKSCEKFERKFSKWQKRSDCILVNSGSSANLAIIQALLNLGRIHSGDKVGFSAVTWSTNVMPLIELGLIPIPIDISIKTLNVSSRNLLDTLKNHPIKLFILTHLLGFCDDVDKIKEICQKKHIILIEDTCESLGSMYQGTKLGNFGLASTFSFYVGHHLSTIEGGAVTTDDEELSIMLRIVRAHGWDRNLSFLQKKEVQKLFRVNSQFYSRYTFYDLGYNLRPTDITGILGLIQIKYLNEIIGKREINFKIISDELSGNQNYYPLSFDHMDLISNFAFPVIVKSPKLRNILVNKCAGKIEIRPIVGGNITMQPFYKKYVRNKKIICPNAELVHRQGLYFGNNPQLNKSDIKTISSIFK